MEKSSPPFCWKKKKKQKVLLYFLREHRYICSHDRDSIVSETEQNKNKAKKKKQKDEKTKLFVCGLSAGHQTLVDGK